MLTATTVSNKGELEQILQLQEINLIRSIDKAEMQSQGFLTMKHTPEILQQMHALASSIIIKDGDTVAAFALVMLRECRQLFPPLEPMFRVFDSIQWNEKPVNDYRFYVMGQICVAKKYRGQGLFEMLHNKHREIHQNQHDFIITEVSTRNHRSLRAHERVGFKTIHTYRDELDEWNVMLWNWK